MKSKNNIGKLFFILLYIFTIYNALHNSTYAVVSNKILLSDENILKYISFALAVVILLLLVLNSKITKKIKLSIIFVYIVTIIGIFVGASLTPLFILLPLSLSLILVNYVMLDEMSDFEFDVLYYTAISIMLFIIFIGLFNFISFVIYMLIIIQLILQDKVSKKKQLIIYLIGLNIMFIIGQFI